MYRQAAPESAHELLQRARELAGLTLAELATQLDIALPRSSRQEKGWAGQLLEVALGASAGSKPVPDFEQLAIELKTLPVDCLGRVLESTFVCTAPLLNVNGLAWHQSGVWRKLSQVLWLPLLSSRGLPPQQRVIGTAFLWQPSADEEALLRQDWEEIMERIALGQVQQITARLGQALQLRPKAAHSRITTAACGPDGQQIQVGPRGFYLRASFTQQLLHKVY